MTTAKIEALRAKQAEQKIIVESLTALDALSQVKPALFQTPTTAPADETEEEHDARIDAIAEEVKNYYISQRKARGIRTVITPWNTPINEILNGAR